MNESKGESNVGVVANSNTAFVPLVVLSLSFSSLMRGQSYRHSWSSVSFLFMTLSIRDIIVRIWLLNAFRFSVMLPLMSLVLSSPTITPLISLVTFLTWFRHHLTLFPLCLHYYHYQ
jgi:hypothetical protein